MTDANRVHAAFPYLIVRDAQRAIEFYKDVFGADEVMRLTESSGRIGHVELKLGPMLVMLADEFPELGIHSPLAYDGVGSMLHLHVDNVDAMTQRAVDAGARIIAEPKNQFYGERSSKLVDPFGHVWMLGQEIEKVSPDEMQRRYTELLSGKS